MTYLNYAPLPKWGHIAKVFLLKTKIRKIFNKDCDSNQVKNYWLSRSSWSIYLIIKFRLLVNENNKVNFWLPDYFCNESLVAIRSLGVRLSFYPVLSNGKPDLVACKKMLDNKVPDVILYVNYFGESMFSEGLSDIALRNNAWFIEDCTHCLKTSSGIGSNGDFIIFSPHKLLAIPDGGLLLIRPNGPNKISHNFLDEFDFDSLYYSVINTHKSASFYSCKWLLKRIMQKAGVHFFRKKNIFVNENNFIDINSLPHPKMSWLSKNLLSNILDLNLEEKHRKNIEKKWQEIIITNKIFEAKSECVTEIKHTPYMAKILNIDSDDSNTVVRIFDLLQKFDIPVSTWPDLPPEVLKNHSFHKTAIKMSTSNIFLPVHSSITSKKLVKKIRSL